LAIEKPRLRQDYAVPMLIGIDASRAVTSRRTGTEYYSLRLIQALLALDSPHKFRLYFSRFHAETFSEMDIQRVELRIIPFARLWTHIRLGIEITRRPPGALFVPAHVLPLLTRVPAVATVHDLGYRHFPNAHPRRQRWYLDWSTRHNARAAQIVVADSEATKADLVKYYGTEPGRAIVAYPGIDEQLSPVDDPAEVAASMQRYGIANPYLLHIGTLQPRKNLVRLVQVFGRLAADSTIQLVLAGKKGWFYDDLYAQVKSLGLQDRVRFVGYIADEDKAALLTGATAYVFPSLYEGFGFPALEAQACNTPLVCSHSSSLPEVAGTGALYFDPKDSDDLAQALSRVLSEPNLRTLLVEEGRRNVRRFSWHSCAVQVMGALEMAAEIHERERSAG
jgi:glycosyltransferase involved in cell wall biosynthesis